MGILTDHIEITRRMCPVIFLLDASGSMDGAPIGAVNSAIENVLPILSSMNQGNPDAEIKFAVLAFSYGADWLTGTELVSPENYVWRNSLNADGPTSMGAAFQELNRKLSVKDGFMKCASGSVAPVLFLLSDGAPTDDYKSGLRQLEANSWYKVAVRVAIGYSEDCNDDVLREFTGNPETVLHTDNPNDLKKLIQFVTITSSMVASKGKSAIAGRTATPDDNTQKLADEMAALGGDINAPMDPEDEF